MSDKNLPQTEREGHVFLDLIMGLRQSYSLES